MDNFFQKSRFWGSFGKKWEFLFTPDLSSWMVTVAPSLIRAHAFLSSASCYDLHDVCEDWPSLRGYWLQHPRAEKGWRAPEWLLSLSSAELQHGTVEEALDRGSSPRTRWCDLRHDLSPFWASVSSWCKMKVGQMAPSFRLQTLVYLQLLVFSYLYPVQ